MNEFSDNRYRNFFVGCILIATFLPALLSVVNFDITDTKIKALGGLFAILLLLNGAHVWMTIAYYFDKNWLKFFNTRKLVFFGGPGLIFLISLIVITQSPKIWALAFFYTASFINLWHHAKQNWGILSILSNIFGDNVQGFRPLIIHSWIFFLIPLSYYIVSSFGLLALHPQILAASYVLVTLYLLWCLKELYFNLFSIKHPVVLIQLLASLLYFLPLIFLRDKYYVLVIWAGAHALQYYFMVFASLSLRSRKSRSTLTLAASMSIMISVLIALTLLSTLFTKPMTAIDYWDLKNLRYFAAILIAVNLSHFWIDAFIWRFSNSKIRNIHGDAFVFSHD